MQRTGVINVEVIEDSESEVNDRFTTLSMTVPWVAFQDIATRTDLAVTQHIRREPIEELMGRVTVDPFMPRTWKDSEATPEQQRQTMVWMSHRQQAVEQAKDRIALGFDERYARELLNPYSWTTILVSGTDWDQLFVLADKEEDIFEITRTICLEAKQAYEHSRPLRVNNHEWHLPFVSADEEAELGHPDACKVSAARCAVLDGLVGDDLPAISEELDLFDRMYREGNLGPLYHVAAPVHTFERVARRNMKYASRYLPEKPHENNAFGLTNLRLLQLECLTGRSGSNRGWTALPLCINDNGKHVRIERS